MVMRDTGANFEACTHSDSFIILFPLICVKLYRKKFPKKLLYSSLIFKNDSRLLFIANMPIICNKNLVFEEREEERALSLRPTSS